VNASLAFIEGAKPRDEVECALVIQMACTHTTAMAVLGRHEMPEELLGYFKAIKITYTRRNRFPKLQ
jgi:hypothetical protein